MFTFLLILQAVVAATLVTLILMQRSEGGGLGVGGSSSGLMTARGQADFLTRATAVTAIAFVGLCILLAGIATTQHRGQTIDASVVQPAAPIDGAPAAAPPAGEQTPASDPVDSDILSTITGQGQNTGGGTDESEQ